MQKPKEKKAAKSPDNSLSGTLCDALTMFPFATRAMLASGLDNADMPSSLASLMSLFAGRDKNEDNRKEE